MKHNGNLKLDDIIDIAKKLKGKSYAKEFKGTVKEVLGTCVSVGCTVDGKKPKEIQGLIDDGEIEINEWLLFNVVSVVCFSKFLSIRFITTI